MKIGVVGTGYVGLPTGVAFAEHGHEVVCIDTDPERIAKLQQGISPIVEKGLPEALQNTLESGDLRFTNDLEEGIDGAQTIFCAVGTPETETGAANLEYVYKVAKDVGGLLSAYTVFVNKSTVPIGTAAAVREVIAAETDIEFDVVSNPEFMAEGSALEDVRKPDRIVIGTSSPRALEIMREVYRTYVRNGHPLMVMSEVSAELTKYGSNGALATKVSYNNELATLAQAVGADIEDVRLAMAADPRIGKEFMYVGPGWGGSCFPKDSRALIYAAEKAGVDLKVIKAADEANDTKMRELPGNVINYFGGDLTGRKIALWGLAFKKNTDDIRESPAIFTLEALLAAGAEVVAYDQAAMENAQRRYADNERVTFGQRYDVLEGADALVVATDWEQFRVVNMQRLKDKMKSPVIFDGRNMIDYEIAKKGGVYYQGNGRPILDPGV